MTGPVQRPDETIPGGRYLNQDGTRWINCWGDDLGPVTCGDCTCNDGECVAPAGPDVSITADWAVLGNEPAKPARGSRTRKAAD